MKKDDPLCSFHVFPFLTIDGNVQDLFLILIQENNFLGV